MKLLLGVLIYSCRAGQYYVGKIVAYFVAMNGRIDALTFIHKIAPYEWEQLFTLPFYE